MHHQRSNAVPAGHVHNALSDSYIVIDGFVIFSIGPFKFQHYR